MGPVVSLRKQIAVLLIGLSLLLVVATYAVQSWVVMPAFAELERQDAIRDIIRGIEGVKRDVESISTTTHDWSAWDDAYKYVQGEYDEFAKGNLIDESFANTRLNLISYLDSKRRIVFADSRDYETLAAIDLSDVLALAQREGGILTNHHDVDSHVEGILMTARGPLMVSARPMTTTKRDAPINGTLIMGRLLSSKEINGLATRVRAKLSIFPLKATELPDDFAHARDIMKGTWEPYISAVDENNLNSYAVIRDIFSEPALIMRIQSQRQMTAQGAVSASIATGCSIGGGLLTLATMWIVLQWRVIRPLQKVAQHAERVGKDDDLKARIGLNRSDEIGKLADKFDEMMASLADSRSKMQDTAHRAGMAEIASEVLHNVGNAVNSANCSVEILDERLGSSKVNGLDRAATLLRAQSTRAGEFFGQDPRGPKLIDYLLNLNDTLKEEHVQNIAEVARLRDTVRHIRDAIAVQQNYAGRSNFRQEVNLELLIKDALRINEELIHSTEVQVALEIPPLPELQLNKSKMTQVLVNLVRNAVQAMQATPSDNRRLEIKVRRVIDSGVEIEIVDTGTGFDDVTRAKLFTHGFTTKPEGNGFGLHYCANAIREADGHIAAQSDGPGKGATFRIRMPHVLPEIATV